MGALSSETFIPWTESANPEADPYYDERRLLAAVIRQAVADLGITRSRLERGRRLLLVAQERRAGRVVRGASYGLEREEAAAYDSALLFLLTSEAFVTMVTLLGLDPECLREGIRRRLVKTIGEEVLAWDLAHARAWPPMLWQEAARGRPRKRKAA